MKLPNMIKEKIEKDKFKVQCTRCGEWIAGTSEKHLIHNFKQHTLYCKDEEKQEEEE